MNVGNFEDYIQEVHKFSDYTNNGKCSNCGGCCSRLLPLACKEIRAIEHYVKTNNIKPVKRNIPVTDKLLNLTCPFRDDDKRKCLIYPVRPYICRIFKCNKPDSTASEFDHMVKNDTQVYDMCEFFN